jgi:hypothetical protein
MNMRVDDINRLRLPLPVPLALAGCATRLLNPRITQAEPDIRSGLATGNFLLQVFGVPIDHCAYSC